MESSVSSFGRREDGESKWCAGVLASDGAVYCAPRQRHKLDQMRNIEDYASNIEECVTSRRTSRTSRSA